jgi:hypothetical protein
VRSPKSERRFGRGNEEFWICDFGLGILPKVTRRDKPSGRSRWVSDSKAALASPRVLIPIVRAWQYLHGSTSVASRLAPSLPAFIRKREQTYEHWTNR